LGEYSLALTDAQRSNSLQPADATRAEIAKLEPLAAAQQEKAAAASSSTSSKPKAGVALPTAKAQEEAAQQQQPTLSDLRIPSAAAASAPGPSRSNPTVVKKKSGLIIEEIED
jgi:hypothetical protein